MKLKSYQEEESQFIKLSNLMNKFKTNSDKDITAIQDAGNSSLEYDLETCSKNENTKKESTEFKPEESVNLADLIELKSKLT